MSMAKSRSFSGLFFALGIGLVFTSTTSGRADEPISTLADVKWLAGRWIEEKDGTVTEEQWMAPRGKRMVGMNRTTVREEKGMFEFLRIEQRASGLVYVAQPNGQPPVEFPCVETKGQRAVFQNLKNDFPQRIIYECHAAGTLNARIEGEINGRMRSMEWRWRTAD